MAKVPFQNSVRTEWRAIDRTMLVNSLMSYFPQITAGERSQIFEELSSPVLDYLELAHYKNDKDEDPRWILVFDRKNIYIDVLDPKNESSVIAEIKLAASAYGRFLRSRPILNSEWAKRIEVLIGIDPKETLRPGETIPDLDYQRVKYIQGELESMTDSERRMMKSFKGAPKGLIAKQDYGSEYVNAGDYEIDDESDDEDIDDYGDMDEYGDEDDYAADYPYSVPVSDVGYLDRASFKLLAKQPIVDWLNQLEEVCVKSRSSSVVDAGGGSNTLSEPRIIWTLEVVNSEPTVFLTEIGLELLPKSESKRAWNALKKKAMEYFFLGYSINDEEWPKVKLTDFDKWFTIEHLGSVVDLESGKF